METPKKKKISLPEANVDMSGIIAEETQNDDDEEIEGQNAS